MESSSVDRVLASEIKALLARRTCSSRQAIGRVLEGARHEVVEAVTDLRGVEE